MDQSGENSSLRETGERDTVDGSGYLVVKQAKCDACSPLSSENKPWAEAAVLNGIWRVRREGEV